MRRRLLKEKTENDSDYVTSVTGEKIKVLQVIPKKHDPTGRSIRDEIFEENGKRYLRKQVQEGITGTISTQNMNLLFVPKINFRLVTTVNYKPVLGESSLIKYYDNCHTWIDGVETVGWSGSAIYFQEYQLGIKFYNSGAFRMYNPNNLSVEESTELLSNKPFRYAVREEEIQIIEIM